jgi:hypothetical protein
VHARWDWSTGTLQTLTGSLVVLVVVKARLVKIASFIHHYINYTCSKILITFYYSHNMSLSPAATSDSTWEPSTTIELLALVVTLPGAIAALTTL